MSISQICDLAYSLQLEMLEDRFRTMESAFYFARTQSAEASDVEPPSFAEIVQKFDDSLNAEFDAEPEKDVFKKFYDLR